MLARLASVASSSSSSSFSLCCCVDGQVTRRYWYRSSGLSVCAGRQRHCPTRLRIRSLDARRGQRRRRKHARSVETLRHNSNAWHRHRSVHHPLDHNHRVAPCTSSTPIDCPVQSAQTHSHTPLVCTLVRAAPPNTSQWRRCRPRRCMAAAQCGRPVPCARQRRASQPLAHVSSPSRWPQE